MPSVKAGYKTMKSRPRSKGNDLTQQTVNGDEILQRKQPTEREKTRNTHTEKLQK